MEILHGFKAVGKALWIKNYKTLVLTDLHIGYEEALAKEGFLVPKILAKEMKQEIKDLLKLKPKIVVINGDLKHEFGEISKQEWFDTLEILDMLLKDGRRVILVKGNHDTILGPIAKKKNLEIVDFYKLKEICFLHGHKIFLEVLDKKIKVLITGHEHPAISLREGVKQEKFKCFLLGKYKDKKTIILPSFLNFPEGTDITKEKMYSPFLRNISDFEIFVVGDKIYKFGKLKEIEKTSNFKN
ncbi:MAG: metallophosphoesterase [Candidatus Pacearchaeota archaeon]|nr:metallophosphoesterase [Candidatus Pacearchaeota archaeon]